MPRDSRLFDLIALNGGSGAVLVYVCYLDDSDAEQSSVITLAGYMAHLDSWQLFEHLTKPLWSANGITVLHANDFHRGCGEFKGWSISKKSEFIGKLYSCVKISGINIGISRSIRKKAYRDRQQELNRNKSMSAYGVAFASILHTLARGNSQWEEISKEKLSFVVESGHNNNEEIELYYHKMKNSESFKDSLGPFVFSDKKDSRAIQLADFFAYYSRRHAARIDGKEPGSLPKPDRFFQLFANTIYHHQSVITDAYAGIVRDAKEAFYKPDRDASQRLDSEIPAFPKKVRKPRKRPT